MASDEIEILPPDHIEAEYQMGLAEGINQAHVIAGAAVGLTMTERLIGDVTRRVGEFFDKWIFNGVDDAGVSHPSREGKGYKHIKRAMFNTERYQRKKLTQAMADVRGETVRITRDKYRDLLNAYVANNVSLVKGVTAEQQRLIDGAMRDFLIAPDAQLTPLLDRLRDIQGKGVNRTNLIGENEVVNLHSDLQMARFSDLSVDQYRWRSSQDERVRPLHRQINGRVYNVGHPTDAEGGLPPGKPVRCRCVAIPLFAAPQAIVPTSRPIPA